MNPSSRFRRNSDFIFREIADESVLVPTGKVSKEFSGMGAMNQTGAFLWKLLEKESTLRELSEALAKEYDLTEEQSLQDVSDFLKAAQARNAVLSC